MFVIGEAVVEDAVGGASFCCDLGKCKGACCCIAGGRGAPLEDDEVLEIQKAFPLIKQFLSPTSIRTIEQKGLVDGTPGDFATACVDDRECVFAYFDGDIAKCSFEKAYLEGTTDWRKPISCHLFPIRIRAFGGDLLRYEEIDECAPARERGAIEQVRLSDFLKEPLIRKYGASWYAAFSRYCSKHSTP